MGLLKRGVLALWIGASAWAAAPVFNIADYGARKDGSALATEAFRSAIQAAKAAGGGTVYVPAGQYISGPIELVSNLVLHIDAGATLRFPATRLPFSRGRWQGIEALTPVPLIGGRNLENVSITGRGVLTTSQPEWTRIMGDPGSGPDWLHLLEILELKKPIPDQEYQKAAPQLLPMFISLMESKNVLIQGIHIVGSAMWPIQLVYDDNAVVSGVMVETFGGHDTGGIYVDSSRNVRISDCYIDTGDDGIVIKSGKDADGRRVNRPAENISITNCNVHRAHGAVVLGSEISGWIRNLVASNITCDGTQMGVRIKTRRGRGGGIEDVRFDNWTMQNVARGINISSFYVMAPENKSTPPEEPVSERTSIYRNIAISHMTINNSRLVIDIEGIPEMPIDGLRISDIVATAQIGMKAYNTKAMELHNVQLSAKTGPVFLIRDSTDLELDNVGSRRPLEEAPVVRLDHCPGAILRGSRAFAGTGTFLSVAPGELKGIVMEGNRLDSARKPAEESAKSYPMLPESATERTWTEKY
uniref:Glycoside hydrolase, family 28 n=1 Tax=Solibacter usitatus (strain Ellin6076) TaxID=234267 RepID=Q02B94_SOLUE